MCKNQSKHIDDGLAISQTFMIFNIVPRDVEN